MFCLLFFGANQLLELNKVYIWPLHTHLDDLLALPIILTVALAVERAYFRAPRFILPLRFSLLALLLFSVVFELVLPLFSPKHTADALDVVAYAIGGAVFHKVLNRPQKKTRELAK